MASDQKSVDQRKILLKYQGEGTFRTVVDVCVPTPPEGCESQQLFDWALCAGVIQGNLPMHLKMRLVEAYCGRHPSIVVEEWHGPWPPPPEASE